MIERKREGKHVTEVGGRLNKARVKEVRCSEIARGLD